MFESSRKKLIAIGCSYTNYMHHDIYWPEFLAEHLDMEVVNLGRAGAGNSYIFSMLQDVLMLKKITGYWPKRTLFNIKNEDIGLVVIMWSELQRMDFESRQHWFAFHPHRNNFKHEQYPMAPSYGRDIIIQWNNVFSATLSTMRLFYLAQLFLKNIPYIFVQGTKPTPNNFGQDYSNIVPK